MVQWWYSKIIIYNYAVVVFVDISPHLCVGFLFLVLYPAVRRPPPVVLSSSCHHTPLAHTQLVHTQLVHSQLVHTPLVITQLVITPLVITQLVITPLAHTSHHHNNLSTCPHTTCHHTTCHHTTCHHTTCHHTTCNPTTCHHTTCHHTTCHHTACSHITPWQQLVITPLDDMDCYFAWQAWHLTTSIVTLRGRRGTDGTGLALVARLVSRRRRDAVAFCVAGVALWDIHLRFTWQAWYLDTSTSMSWWKHLLPGNDFIAQIQHSRASSSLIVLLRYVCWKRLMPGTAFIGRPNTLVRRDLWSYC